MIPTEALCVLIEKLIYQFLEIVVVHKSNSELNL
jgi:hypothetical protein